MASVSAYPTRIRLAVVIVLTALAVLAAAIVGGLWWAIWLLVRAVLSRPNAEAGPARQTALTVQS